MINKVTLLGRIGQDPIIKDINGNELAEFSVATTKTWKDKNTGEKQEKTEWHSCKAWRSVGFISQYVTKGSLVYIEGAIETRSWEGDDGKKRYKTEVLVDEIKLCSSKRDSGDGDVPAYRESVASRTAEKGSGGGGRPAGVKNHAPGMEHENAPASHANAPAPDFDSNEEIPF